MNRSTLETLIKWYKGGIDIRKNHDRIKNKVLQYNMQVYKCQKKKRFESDEIIQKFMNLTISIFFLVK